MLLQPTYILHLTFASVAAVYCLLGYWLAFGKQGWIWRAGAVCAALALLVPIRAYEPLVFFALTSLLFVAAASGWWLVENWRKKGRKGSLETNGANLGSSRPRFQFHLHDLLGLMAVFGAAAWMVRTLLREQVMMPWVGTFISVAVAVAITLATIGLLRGPRRVVSGVVLLLVVGASVGYFHWLHRIGAAAIQYVIGGDLGEELLGFQPGGSNYSPALRLTVLLLLFQVFLGILCGGSRTIQPKEAFPSRQRIWPMLRAATGIAWFSVVGWLYLQLLSYPQPPAKISDRPNSLRLLLERGRALETLSGARARTVSAEVIELSKEPGFVSVPWDADLLGRRNYDQNLLGDVQSARSISRGLDARATALETTNPDLAADHVMAIVRLGNMEQHEGLLVHSLFGIAIASVGETHLARLRRKISLSKAGEIIAEFEAMEKSRDHDGVARDKLWYSLNDRWAFRLDQVLNAGTDRTSESTYFHYGLTCNRSSCMTRLFMIDLALHAYKAEHGDYPHQLESLAPQYLAEVPLDPFSDKPFVYRSAAEPADKKAAQDFVLYSVGGDGVDNGGNFGPQQQIPNQWDGFDLNLDASRQ